MKKLILGLLFAAWQCFAQPTSFVGGMLTSPAIAFPGGSSDVTVQAALMPSSFYLTPLTNTLVHHWASNYMGLTRFFATNGPSLDTYNTNYVLTNWCFTAPNYTSVVLMTWSIAPSNNAWLQEMSAYSNSIAISQRGTTNVPSGWWEVQFDLAYSTPPALPSNAIAPGSLYFRPEILMILTNNTFNQETNIALGLAVPARAGRQLYKQYIKVPDTTLTNNLAQVVLVRLRAMNITGSNYVTLYTGGTNQYIRTPQPYLISGLGWTNLIDTNFYTRPIKVGGSDGFGLCFVGRGSQINNTTNYIGAGFVYSPDGVNWGHEYNTNGLIWMILSPQGSNRVVWFTNIASTAFGNIDSIRLACVTNNTSTTNVFFLTNIYVITKPRAK